jgi:hypothetical protein
MGTANNANNANAGCRDIASSLTPCTRVICVFCVLRFPSLLADPARDRRPETPAQSLLWFGCGRPAAPSGHRSPRCRGTRRKIAGRMPNADAGDRRLVRAVACHSAACQAGADRRWSKATADWLCKACTPVSCRRPGGTPPPFTNLMQCAMGLGKNLIGQRLFSGAVPATPSAWDSYVVSSTRFGADHAARRRPRRLAGSG